MTVRHFLREPWGGWAHWFCACGKHSYSVTFVRYAQPGESDCVRCGTGPTRLVRVERRAQRPSWFEVGA